jgi:hypothetical protein
MCRADNGYDAPIDRRGAFVRRPGRWVDGSNAVDPSPVGAYSVVVGDESAGWRSAPMGPNRSTQTFIDHRLQATRPAPLRGHRLSPGGSVTLECRPRSTTMTSASPGRAPWASSIKPRCGEFTPPLVRVWNSTPAARATPTRDHPARGLPVRFGVPAGADDHAVEVHGFETGGVCVSRMLWPVDPREDEWTARHSGDRNHRRVFVAGVSVTTPASLVLAARRPCRRRLGRTRQHCHC